MKQLKRVAGWLGCRQGNRVEIGGGEVRMWLRPGPAATMVHEKAARRRPGRREAEGCLVVRKRRDGRSQGINLGDQAVHLAVESEVGGRASPEQKEEAARKGA